MRQNRRGMPVKEQYRDEEYEEEYDEEYSDADEDEEYYDDEEDDSSEEYDDDEEYYDDEDDDYLIDDEDSDPDEDEAEYLIPPRAVKKPALQKTPKQAPSKAPKQASKHVPKEASKPEKKKKSAFGKFVRTLFVIAFILLGGLYVFVWYVYGGVKYEEVSSVKNEAFSEDGVTNILLIGNDSRKNGTDGRSDAMILLSISNRTHRILFTSLLRDMYVDIPGHGKNRLNSAYSYGGPELLMETVEENFGIRVNRYVSVNFEAFAGMVDAVGGVDMNVTSDEVFLIDAYLNEYNMLLGREITTDYLDPTLSGWVKLNGAQALAYTRNRYIGTDFGRTERQRKVIDAVIKAFPGALVRRGPVIIKEMASYMTTNLTLNECYLLALQGWTPFVYGRDMGSLPVEGTWNDYKANGMAVLKVDFDANRKYLDEMLFTGTKEDDNG
ncbi:MAG: LCP family protein [Lachnospiraceae bacterium]|nr:LCP family protein [Lachnospiraceae bacterium]